MTRKLLSIFAILSMAACTTPAPNVSEISTPPEARVPSSAKEIISDKKAVLGFCPPGVSDCGGASITVHGKGYRAAGATKEIQETLSGVIGSYEFHKMTKSAPFAVSGYVETVTSHGGWGPPKSEVFFITEGLDSLRVPK